MTEYNKLMKNLLNIKVTADKNHIASDDDNDNSKYGRTLHYLHRQKYLLDLSRLDSLD